MSGGADWPEVLLEAPRAQVAALEDWLLAAGALSVTLCDQADQPILEPAPGATPLWEAVQMVGLFEQGRSPGAIQEQLLLAAASRGVSPPAWRFQALPDSAWARAWMDDFQPMAFGPRLWVCPSHCAPPEPGAINLQFDPGLAFGSGTHATTAQCLRWLGRDTAAELAPLDGRRVIDYGCGSGILAVAAACLGAREVLAVDIDEQALLATRDNARRNRVDGRVQVGHPEWLADQAPASLLLANILFQPLMELAGQLVALVQPGGTLVLSGLLDEQTETLMSHYRTLDVSFDPPRSQDGWALLVGRCAVS